MRMDVLNKGYFMELIRYAITNYLAKFFLIILVLGCTQNVQKNMEREESVQKNGKWVTRLESTQYNDSMLVINHINNPIVVGLFENNDNYIEHITLSSNSERYSISCNSNKVSIIYNQDDNNTIKQIILYDGDSAIRKPTGRVVVEKVNGAWNIVDRKLSDFNTECK